jgi:hypothetical protein
MTVYTVVMKQTEATVTEQKDKQLPTNNSSSSNTEKSAITSTTKSPVHPEAEHKSCYISGVPLRSLTCSDYFEILLSPYNYSKRDL